MTPWLAQITTDRTADGNWVLLENGHYTVGSEVEVDLDSRAVKTFEREGKQFQAEVVAVAPIFQANRVWFPVEMLML